MDDGGPAFPWTETIEKDCQLSQVWHPGLSKRDWFAGQALEGWFASMSKDICVNQDFADNISDSLYMMADAMLVARTKSQETP